MSAKFPTVKVEGKSYSLLMVETVSEPKFKRKSRPRQRYFLLDTNKKLGEGTFGVVYEAYEAKPIFNGAGKLRSVLITDPAKILAIKIEKDCNPQNQGEMLRLRKVEAKIQSKFFDTTVYPIGNDGIATVMPKLPGQSLRDLIKTEKFKKLTLSQRLELAALIAQTYAEFHAKRYHWVNGKLELRDGLSHTDLKPANFLIDIRYADDDINHDHPIFECNIIDFADLNAVTPFTTAPECLHGYNIGFPLEHTLEMETYSLTAMIAPILGETDVFKDKENSENVNSQFNLNKMKEYLETETKGLNLESEMKAVIDMIQSMQDDNPALRPSDLAIVKVLNRARLAVLKKERNEPDDADVEHNEPDDADVEIERLTPLGVAVKYGKCEDAKSLLEKYSAEEKKIAMLQTDGNGRTLLHLAILAKNTDLVQLLLDNGAEVNKRDADKRTPLNCAISMRCGLEIVKSLLDKGAKVEAKDNHSRYPVEVAIVNKCDVDVVEFLIEQTPEYKNNRKKRNTKIKLFILAVNSGSEQLVEHFLDEDIIAIKDNLSASPLHFSVLKDHVSVAKFLIERGFDPNEQNSKGHTPLYCAAMAGQLEMVKLLLQNGANSGEKNIANSDKKNIAKKKFHELTDLDGNTLLHLAVINGDIELVKLLIARGASVNVRNSQKMTPLHLATIRCNLELVQLLLEENADPNIADKMGKRFHERTFSGGGSSLSKQTLLHIAINQGKVGLAKLLIARGANVKAQNSEGMTPLHLAANRNEFELVQLLLEKEADPNIADNAGIKFDVNAKNSEGMAPLHLACLNRNIEAVKNLLKNGVDVSAQDELGNTPLHYAILKNAPELVALLLQNGAKGDVKNDSGVTPLRLCVAQKGSDEMQQLLSGVKVVSIKNLHRFFTQKSADKVELSKLKENSFICRKLRAVPAAPAV